MVSISNFNSIYELMVAFAFAYGGIESFTQWIVKFKPLDKELNNIIQLVKFSSANSKLIGKDDYLANVGIEVLKKHQVKLLNSSRGLGELFESLKNGKLYSPQFYLIGLYYLSVLLLAGFEENQGAKVTYILFLLLTIVCIFFMCLFINRNMNKCLSDNGLHEGWLKKINPEFQAFIYIPIFIVLFFLVKIFNTYIPLEIVNFINENREWLILFSLIPMILPFSNFFFFESFYQVRLEGNISNIKESEEHKAIQNLYNHILSTDLTEFNKVLEKNG